MKSRNIINMQFAAGINALAEKKQELESLVESPVKPRTKSEIEVGADRTKLMTNNANDIRKKIKYKGQK